MVPFSAQVPDRLTGSECATVLQEDGPRLDRLLDARAAVASYQSLRDARTSADCARDLALPYAEFGRVDGEPDVTDRAYTDTVIRRVGVGGSR